MAKTLQIVCFNVPYPPNFGGVIDVFYKIKALHELGIILHIHCFTYNDYQPAKELDSYCEKVYYYPRSGDILRHLSHKPFIVNSRKQPALLKNLENIGAPIIFEGLHSTAFLNEEKLRLIPKAIRMHNVESAYYKKLAHWEPNLVRKTYFFAESTRLANYEESIYYADVDLLAISNFDFMYYDVNHRGQTSLIFPFHPFDGVNIESGSGSYIFLHGDFSISENRLWVEELLGEICEHAKLNIRVAGRKASLISLDKIQDRSKLTIESDVSIERMHQLLQEAHINIVQSFNSEGFKLKLLYCLFSGRHCIANDHILKGTELNELVHVANETSDVLKCIEVLEEQQFDQFEIDKRAKILNQRFSNQLNAQKIVNILLPNA